MSMIEKRADHAILPHGTVSGVGAGMVIAPAAAWVLSMVPLLPGGFVAWLVIMMVIGIIVY